MGAVSICPSESVSSLAFSAPEPSAVVPASEPFSLSPVGVSAFVSSVLELPLSQAANTEKERTSAKMRERIFQLFLIMFSFLVVWINYARKISGRSHLVIIIIAQYK
jgi:hypothetical protein